MNRFYKLIIYLFLALISFIFIILLKTDNILLIIAFLSSLILFFVEVYFRCEFSKLKNFNGQKGKNKFDAVVSIKEDIIGRIKEVDEICKFIERNTKGHILISGGWGSGKTSLINFVKERLQGNSKKYDFFRI
jgi:hypothetical protein